MLFVAVHSHIPHYEANRTPLSEQNTSKEEEAENVFHSPADSRIGETFPQTEIPGVRRAGVSCQDAQDDRRSSQNLVPKPTYKMEVSSIFALYCGWNEVFETLKLLYNKETYLTLFGLKLLFCSVLSDFRKKIVFC